ncbi:acetyltransferase [Rhizobium sp. KVB221]|uniref:Acetyltransferase n=1 Tax=Rhizobium setariae TaxID=2801340 RepID=A0A937CQA5_9HYPH|nr:GNAT family N-acetyltransferase [Rhizobium setariae]MBL0374199.1 acetyltransferase [Rhizobium setariae]
MRSNGVYGFRPLEQADLPLLKSWLSAPHVRQWWGDPEGEIAEMSEFLDGSSVRPYIVSLLDRPIGYIQSYDPHQEYEHPYRDQPAGTLGIDQFIGVADLTGLGHGPAMIRAFCRMLVEAGASRVVTDPDPDNRNAIRAYQKAGFVKDDIRNTEYGTVLMMHVDARYEMERR